MHDIDTTRLEAEPESQIHEFEPAEFEVAFSAVSLAAETIGFVSQKSRR